MSESREDYLKTILLLRRSRGSVRAVDIAEYMGFSKPSVSVALRGMCADGLTYLDEGEVGLTPKGEAAASEVLQRYHFLSKFFVALGVPPERADLDAHKVEHAISPDSFAALKKRFASDLAEEGERT